MSSINSTMTGSSLPIQQPTIDEEIDNLTQIELRRRRQSFIFLLFFFLLIRLWLQALLTGDGRWLPICAILTIWFTRIQHQRRLEDEELQTQWQNVLGRQLQQPHEVDGGHNIHVLPVDAIDLARGMEHVPFQLQLALAMLESQRMMQAVMANGNMPIRADPTGRGVSEDVRAQWKHFTFDELQGPPLIQEHAGTNRLATPMQELDEESPEPRRPSMVYSIFHRAFAAQRHHSENFTAANSTADEVEDARSAVSRKRDQYASIGEYQHEEANEVYLSTEEGNFESGKTKLLESQLPEQTIDNTQQQHVASGSNEQSNRNVSLLVEEDVSCSICLEPYVRGDAVVELPCRHIYHDECISCWISNNVKCPLCNFDLESGTRNLFIESLLAGPDFFEG